jgi:hypothetical protein
VSFNQNPKRPGLQLGQSSCKSGAAWAPWGSRKWRGASKQTWHWGVRAEQEEHGFQADWVAAPDPASEVKAWSPACWAASVGVGLAGHHHGRPHASPPELSLLTTSGSTGTLNCRCAMGKGWTQGHPQEGGRPGSYSELPKEPRLLQVFHQKQPLD